MRVRAALVSVMVLLTATLSAAADAKPLPKPQIVDPKGDAAAGQGSLDIVSVQYSTTGSGSGKAYVPKKLVVALTLVAPPNTSGLVAYNLRAMTDTCSSIRLRYFPGTPLGGLVGDSYAHFGSCSPDGGMFFNAKVKGSVVTMEFSLKATGLERGSELSEFRATVDASDPAGALTAGSELVMPGLGDSGAGDGTWIVP
ncbi:MAG TPA: hypothetical protein VNA12_04130 [Mycobacteriales bacterium]|nr:hypothetical protein [Mycobacteriales bacterium]